VCSATSIRVNRILSEAATARTRTESGPLSSPDKEQSKQTKEMKNTYCPVDPVTTATFQEVLRDHCDCALEILLMSYALQDVLGMALDQYGTNRYEVPMSELEIALGCGVEAACKCAEMSGFSPAGDGGWFVFEGDTLRVLSIEMDLLARFTREIAEHL